MWRAWGHFGSDVVVVAAGAVSANEAPLPAPGVRSWVTEDEVELVPGPCNIMGVISTLHTTRKPEKGQGAYALW